MPWHFAAEIPSQYFIGCFTRFPLEELAVEVSDLFESALQWVVEQAAKGLHFLFVVDGDFVFGLQQESFVICADLVTGIVLEQVETAWPWGDSVAISLWDSISLDLGRTA